MKFSHFSERAYGRSAIAEGQPVAVEALGAIYPDFGHSFRAEAEEAPPVRNDLLDLGIGSYFPCAEAIVEAAVSALRAGHTRYESLAALKEAIAAKYRAEHGVALGQENIMLLGGARPGMALTMLSGLEPGDRVAIPDPDYIGLTHMASAVGARIERVPMRRGEAGALRLDVTSLEAVAAGGLDAILLTNPNNPTGNVLSRDELAAIAILSQRSGILVMVNEIYDKLAFDSSFTSYAAIGDLDNSVIVGGTSKSYDMTGFGIGWLVSSPRNVARMEDLAFLTHQSKPDAVSQYAALAALTPPIRDSSPAASVGRLKANAASTAAAFEGFDGCYCPIPQAGQFAFPFVDADDLALARYLVAQVGLQVVPGSVWGSQGAGHLRIALANPAGHQAEGLDRLRRGIAQFRARRDG